MEPKRSLATIALLILLSSCSRDQPNPTPVPNPTDKPPVVTLPFTDRAITTPTPLSLTLRHELGVSIQYPASWSAELTTTGTVFISPADARLLWEVFRRPLGERTVADPKTWVPNEGGYDIYWSRPILIQGAEGLEFIWGPYHGGSWEVAPELLVILYSEEHQLDIRLSTFFDGDTIALLAEEGPEATISKRFQVFEQMLESLHIESE